MRRTTLILLAIIIFACFIRLIQPTEPYTTFDLLSTNFPEPVIHTLTVWAYTLPLFLILFKTLITVVGCLIVYLFTLKLTESESASIVATLVFSIAQVSIWFGGYGYWSGESIFPILAFGALYLLIIGLEHRHKKSLLYAAIGFGVLGVSWNGGLYWTAIAIAATIAYYKPDMTLWITTLSILAFFSLNLVPAVINLTNLQYPYLWEIVSILTLNTNFGNLGPAVGLLGVGFPPLASIGIPAVIGSLQGTMTFIKSKLHYALLASLLPGLVFCLFFSFWLSLIYIPICVFAGAGWKTIYNTTRLCVLRG